MSKKRNILIAFLLNLFFSIFEFFGGLYSRSIAIMSDALHDAGDALSIGISYFLERKSEKKPNSKYTYGYRRYSVLGALVTTIILIMGSIIVIGSSIKRLFFPSIINYDSMIILAIIGFIINLIATFITKEEDNLNLKAVNLHMLEDVLGWLTVLVGAIIIKITKIYYIDAILSIGVALFILVHALRNFKTSITLFLEKVPDDVNVKELEEAVLKVKNVLGVHHIHLWSMDGEEVYATMHIISKLKNFKKVKDDVKKTLNKEGISHITIEMEEESDKCDDIECQVKVRNNHHHHH